MSNESYFDDQIAPRLAALAKECHQNGVSFLAVCEWAPGEIGRTSAFQPECGIGLQIAEKAAHTNGNIDQFMTSIMRHAEHYGHNSFVLEQLGIPPQPNDAGSPRPDMLSHPDAFKHACWLFTQHTIVRYLLANTDGRLNGFEKAQRHMELCSFYVAVVRGVEIDLARRRFEDDYQRVHDVTQQLTSYLDTEIGFPLKGCPDYDRLSTAFFDRFHALAMEALNVSQPVVQVKIGRPHSSVPKAEAGDGR